MNERFTVGLTLLIPALLLCIIDLHASMPGVAFSAVFFGLAPGGVLMWNGRRAEIAGPTEQFNALISFALLLVAHLIAALPWILSANGPR